MTRVLVVAVSAVVLSGCGIFSASSACDFREAAGSSAEPRCQERLNTVSAEAFKAACGVSGGKASDGTCPRAGVVAGCMIGVQGDGSKVNDWFYAPKTRSDVMSECGSAPFLEP